MTTAKTHFAQISIETVKNIAKEFTDNGAMEGDPGIVETQNEFSSPKERWCEVAQAIEHENDPHKMIELVQELIATFDEEQKRRGLPPKHNPGTHSNSPKISPADGGFPKSAS
jgi:hypothetical protein